MQKSPVLKIKARRRILVIRIYPFQRTFTQLLLPADSSTAAVS
jgi:hypothetical protein